jgi:HK97 family phage major capsid protein
MQKSIDDLEKTINEGVETLKGQTKSWKEELERADSTKASKDEVEAIKQEYSEKLTKQQEQLDALTTEQNRLKTKGGEKAESLKEQVEKVFTKSRIQEIQAGQKASFELKSTNMVTSNTVASGSRIPLWDREPGVAKTPDRSPFVTDIISIGALTGGTISWVERTARGGGSAQTAEGASYAQLSTTYTEYSIAAEYTTVYSKISNKNMDDVDFLVGEIQTEIFDSLELKVDEQLLSGSGTAPNHKGILSYATTFAMPTGFVTKADPKVYDAIAAAILQVQIAKFYPTHIVMHPTDARNMALNIDTQGKYLEPYFVTQDQNGVIRVMGIPVVENLGATVGQVLVGDFTKSKFFVRQGIQIQIWDQNEDDALKGFKTITGTTRGAHRIKGVEAPAFVKGTLSAMLTAIKTV